MAEFNNAGTAVVIKLEQHEVGLLRSLLAEMTTLLEADIGADPVNKRLFPDAYDSSDDAQAYRELVGNELKTTKLEAVKEVQSTLESERSGAIELSRESAESWLPVLTDMRLAIGTRNDVTEEKMAEELDPNDPESAGMLVLHWLGWLQESLLETLTKMEAQD